MNISELSTDMLAEIMGDAADRRDGEIMMSLFSKLLITDTDLISDKEWSRLLEQAYEIRKSEDSQA